MKRKIWTVLFLVMVVCVSTGILSGIYVHTDPLVRKNERVKIQRSVLEIFDIPYEEASVDEIFKQNVDTEIINNRNVYRSRGGSIAFQIKGPGFWGEITALIALEPDLKTIKGLKILSNTETPGLGGRIGEAWFQDQFKGKTLTPELKIVSCGKAKEPDEINAVTEATQTSKTNEVNAITGATQTSKALERLINDNTSLILSH